MPLAFDTLSHGTIPFGFFNVESDMVLLGHHFLFASDLCSWIAEWAGRADAGFREERRVFSIAEPGRIGDLHGAMRGSDLSGFIGAVYRRFPFPPSQAEFRQKGLGYLTQDWMDALIREYAEEETIVVEASAVERTLAFGGYVFTARSWGAIIDYLWRGGWPRWQDGSGPEYVTAMARSVQAASHWLVACATCR